MCCVFIISCLSSAVDLSSIHFLTFTQDTVLVSEKVDFLFCWDGIDAQSARGLLIVDGLHIGYSGHPGQLLMA
jgi:hypothetical protein